MEFLMQQQNPVINEMCNISAVKHRKIYLNEEINEESLFKLFFWLERLERIDKVQGTKEPIEIVLDTFGGDAEGTLAVISKIESMKKNGYYIITSVRTRAYSGGFWIFISGSKRLVLNNSRIMTHNILSNNSGRHQDLLDDIEEIGKIWTRLKKVVTDYTLITDEKMEEIKKNKYDLYFWGDEAIKYGIADEII